MRIALPIAVACTFALTACTPPKPSEESVQWLTPPIETYANWKKDSDSTHDLVLAYYANRSNIALRLPSGEVQTLVDGSVNNSAPSGLAAAIGKNEIATMWRDKIPSKGLFLKQGANAPIELGEGTAPLARFSVIPDGAGWHVLWYGEQPVEGIKSKYNVYYRHVDEKGQSSPTERLFSGFYFQSIVDASGDLAVATWDNNQTPPKLILRVRHASTGTFEAERVISPTTANIPPLINAFRIGSRWFVTWLNQGGDNGNEFSLQGAWSDDKGAQWKRFDIPALNGFDVVDVSVTGDAASGNLVMAVSGSWRFVNQDPKSLFYVIRSQDYGATWQKPEMIREDAANADSHARKAEVALGAEPGSVWLLWEDWREVRPRIYFAYSTDFGASWKHKNIPLAGQPKGGNLLQSAKQATGIDPKGLFYLAANLVNDSMKEEKLFSQHLNTALADLSAQEFAQRPSPSEADLKKRVGSYWQAMQDADYDKSNSLLDPFMRSKWTIEDYKKRMGRIKYTAHTIENIDIRGNLADVRVKITGSVPKFMNNGKEVSAPERDAVIVERWLFLDGAWYREYNEESSETKFTHYNK